MYGNMTQVLPEVRSQVTEMLENNTSAFSLNQREIANQFVGMAMAELSWKSDTDPNAEKKWELSKVAERIANEIVLPATEIAKMPEEQLRDLFAGPALRQLAEAIKLKTINILAQDAGGR